MIDVIFTTKYNIEFLKKFAALQANIKISYKNWWNQSKLFKFEQSPFDSPRGGKDFDLPFTAFWTKEFYNILLNL